MAWGQFASLWAVLELQCRKCQSSRQVVVTPFAVVALVAVFGLTPIAVAKELFKKRFEWYRPLAVLLMTLLALPFLAFGVFCFGLALLVKFFLYLFCFSRRCSACGSRRWRVSNWGILDFMSTYWSVIGK